MVKGPSPLHISAQVQISVKLSLRRGPDSIALNNGPKSRIVWARNNPGRLPNFEPNAEVALSWLIEGRGKIKMSEKKKIEKEKRR